MKTPSRIVITGAPASGKTIFFERLRAHPEFRHYLFFDELARTLLLEDPTYRKRWGEFHREIYRRQVERENLAANQPFITDRGTADAFAFHPETVADVGTTLAAEHSRYSAVVQLGSSAGLGDAYYPRDDVRTEPIEQALRIEDQIRIIWQQHPRYSFIPAEPLVETKYRTFERLMLRLIQKEAGNI